MCAAIRWLGILAILLLAAGSASAAGGNDLVKGSELVVAKDLAERTLQIGDETLDVTPATKIRMDGESLRLEDVPVPRQEGGTPLSEMRWGIYEARREHGRLVLKALELVPVPR